MQASSEAPPDSVPGDVLVTGASRGIGLALARQHLERGHRVFGLSRTVPPSLAGHAGYVHVTLDLARCDGLGDALRGKLIRPHGLTRLSRLFLNAGQFSPRIADVAQVPLAELQALMDLNVWANKLLLDALLQHGVGIEACVVSSSIAGVRARGGNSGYAISKAALNMLVRLYALEQPATYFALLGLCNVDTELARRIGALPLEGTFPDLEGLRRRGAQAGYLATAAQRADDIHRLLVAGLREHLPSGEFAEVRTLKEAPWFQAAACAPAPCKETA
ncbi:SDR family NAD(P)-dependent oxidoreductase [Aquincola sp. MAHUQ-54]|uniref:SDR family NAD(P)-dependent oxidoreductase n=1 Tax=Aquincola agrisoli TaxID=3119538 RepID=A0AAW9PYX7_9BURK